MTIFAHFAIFGMGKKGDFWGFLGAEGGASGDSLGGPFWHFGLPGPKSSQNWPKMTKNDEK